MPPSSPPEPFPLLLVSLLLAAAVLAPTVTVIAVRSSGITARHKAALLAATAIFGLFAAFKTPIALNPDSFVIMQDGTSLQNLKHVHGGGVHSSPFTSQLARLVAPEGDAVRLPSLIRLNRMISIAACTIFFGIAAFITGSALAAIPISWIFLSNRNMSLVSSSEFPGPGITVIFLLVFIAGFAISRLRGRRAFEAIPALALIAVSGMIAAGLRPEAGAAVLVVLAIAALVAVMPPARLHAMGNALSRFAADAARRPREALEALIAALVFFGTAFALERMLSPPASWVAGAFNPLNHGFSSIPTFLMLFLPTPVVLLAGAGLLITARSPVKWLLLPVVAVLLPKLHVAASGTEFNHWFRLFSMDVPLVMLLATVGLGRAIRFTSTWTAHRFWKLAAAAAIASSVLLPIRTAGNPAGYVLRPELRDGGIRLRNPQIEVNYLIKLQNEHPECLFQTTVFDHGSFKDAWFGKNLKVTLDRPTAWSGCTMFYLPLDCNFRDGPDCSESIKGLEEVESITFENAPYGQVAPYLDRHHRNTVTLGLYRRHQVPGDGGTSTSGERASHSENEASSAL
ncbi:MAG TPA: hypothetical protein PLC24_02165 [Myxococcota bacterium]|nr:hypothetical protein [Myxococcota bacterium]HPV03346.1 hypothetical protein [Myxococcota bacterium]